MPNLTHLALFSFFSIYTFGLFTGCGNARPFPQVVPQSSDLPSLPVPPQPMEVEQVPTDSEKSLPSDGTRLRIRVFSESQLSVGDKLEFKIPDPDRSLEQKSSFDEDASIEGNQIFYQKPILFPELKSKHGKEIFFVWSKNAFGSPIQEAIFSHKTLENHITLRDSENYNVDEDSDLKRQFISISRLIKNKEILIDENKIQIISLQFVLEDLSYITIQIFFKIGKIDQS